MPDVEGAKEAAEGSKEAEGSGEAVPATSEKASAEAPKAMAEMTDDEKIAARAKRWGLPERPAAAEEEEKPQASGDSKQAANDLEKFLAKKAAVKGVGPPVKSVAGRGRARELPPARRPAPGPADAEEEAKRRKRAERFTTGKNDDPEAVATPSKGAADDVDKEEEERRRKRAERFPPLRKADAESDAGKDAKTTAADDEEEERRRKRADRFKTAR
eukprot:TRINITY_DN7994_c0_g1_i1.p1 TRINITY_DN7994_c0_g1~~TRINITY_DN7994_c0_g1_i1.p1  ORF type:complete len:216 (+),score=71.66 TRINITY_DN7994_c0_g1_i1:34-681(+)